MDSPQANTCKPVPTESPPIQSPPIKDSPFSLYVSNLSPIQPVNATSSHTYNDLTFPSPEPVFTSPHPRNPRKLDLIRRPEQSLFPSSTEKIATSGPSGLSLPAQQISSKQKRCANSEIARQTEDQSCSSSPSTSVDQFLVDPTENSDSQKLDTDLIIKGEDSTENPIIELDQKGLSGKSLDCSKVKNPRPSGIGLHLNSIAPMKSGSHSTENCEGEGEQQEGSALIALESPLMCDFIDPYVTPDNTKGTVSKDNTNQSSPKRKRRKTNGDDGKKSCNCKRSKCLKLYCDCFGAGLFCTEECACRDCSNRAENADIVRETKEQIESRNPLAFAPKVVLRATQPNLERKEMTPPSTRHKRGCNCKKSLCLKKYCECFQAGVGCFFGCRCEGCKNTFGRKEDGGEIMVEIEHKRPLFEREQEETNENKEIQLAHNRPHAMSPLTPSIQPSSLSHVSCNFSTSPEPLALVPLYYERSPTSPSHLHATDLACKEDLLPLDSYYPFSPTSSNPSSSISSQHTVNSSKLIFQQSWGGSPATPLLPLEKKNKLVLEEETPDAAILLEEVSLQKQQVKSSSPKKKRVSPPHHLQMLSPRQRQRQHQLSPGLRSGRKFILKSVPSLPPLSPYSNTNNNDDDTAGKMGES